MMELGQTPGEHSYMKSTGIFIGLLLILSGCPTFAHDNPNLAECEKLYSETKFGDADVALQALLTRTPSDASAHYLLANVLLKLGKPQDALHHYTVAAELTHDPALSQYCQAAIAQLSKQVPPIHQPSVQPTTASVESREHQTLRRSVEDVSRETDNASDRESAECAAKLREVTDDYDRQISQLQQEMSERIKPLQDAVWYDRWGRPQRDASSINESLRIQAEWDTKRKDLEKQKQRKLVEVQQTYDARRQALEEYATNIDRAYLHRDQAAPVKLAPLGTNMYTKNYQTMGEPSGSVMPLRAAPATTLPQTPLPPAVPQPQK